MTFADKFPKLKGKGTNEFMEYQESIQKYIEMIIQREHLPKQRVKEAIEKIMGEGKCPDDVHLAGKLLLKELGFE